MSNKCDIECTSNKVDVNTLKVVLEREFADVKFWIGGGNVWTKNRKMFNKYFWDGFYSTPKSHLELRRKLSIPNLIILTPDESEAIVGFTLD